MSTLQHLDVLLAQSHLTLLADLVLPLLVMLHHFAEVVIDLVVVSHELVSLPLQVHHDLSLLYEALCYAFFVLPLVANQLLVLARDHADIVLEEVLLRQLFSQLSLLLLDLGDLGRQVNQFGSHVSALSRDRLGFQFLLGK